MKPVASPDAPLVKTTSEPEKPKDNVDNLLLSDQAIYRFGA